MSRSARLKIERAGTHLEELERLLATEKPYIYVVDTDWSEKKRYTQARAVQPVLDRASTICGDVVHNLRTALDHAFWERVSPFTMGDKERKQIQFPFTQDVAKLPKLLESKFADRVGAAFVQALTALGPHGGSGGNEDLCLIDALDIMDKHRLLIPFFDKKEILFSELRRQIPGFKYDVVGSIQAGANVRDVGWPLPAGATVIEMRFQMKVLDIAVDTYLTMPGKGAQPVIPTLQRLQRAAAAAEKVVREA